MSKYYKADDVIRKRAEDLADTSYWEWGNPKNVDDWIEVAEMEFANLPTIEVMEYPQVEGITPTLVTPEASEGEWLFEEYPDGYYHSKCSICEHWFIEDAFLKPYKFCPNCGSRMKGVDNE